MNASITFSVFFVRFFRVEYFKHGMSGKFGKQTLPEDHVCSKQNRTAREGQNVRRQVLP